MSVSKWFKILSFGDSKRYKNLLLWVALDSIIASIPYGIILLAIYYLMGPITGENAVNTKALWIIVLVLAVQAILYLFIRKRTYILSCCGMANGMRQERITMGEHLRKLSLGFFNRKDAGELSTVLLRDFTTIENLSNSFAPQAVITCVRLILAFIMLSVFDIRMSLALFISIPCAIPFAIISYKRMNISEHNLNKAQQQAASGVIEYVEGIQTLKAFNMSGDKFNSLKDAFDRQRKEAINVESKVAAPTAILGRMVLNLGIAITIGSGAYLTYRLSLSPFYYIAFLVMTLNIYEPVSILMFFITDFARTNKAYDRISEIYNEKPLSGDNEENIDVSNTKNFKCNKAIVFKDVSFAYSDKMVIKNFNACFEERKITALVGPSGSGKSTITKLIARFWDVNKGQILLGNKKISDMSSDELLSKISMVFQDVYLFHDTILNNIKMAKEDASMEEIIKVCKRANCHDFIMSLPKGYDTMVGEGGSTLSGGEKQRISIARALLKDAPIVLLDEATASLDPENEVLIQSAINELVMDKTVIIVAHRLKSVSNADKIIVLNEGRVFEEGNHNELIEKNGMYAHLWEEQCTAGNWRLYANSSFYRG